MEIEDQYRWCLESLSSRRLTNKSWMLELCWVFRAELCYCPWKLKKPTDVSRNFHLSALTNLQSISLTNSTALKFSRSSLSKSNCSYPTLSSNPIEEIIRQINIESENKENCKQRKLWEEEREKQVGTWCQFCQHFMISLFG